MSRAVVEDLTRWEPRVVLVQRGHAISALDHLLLDEQFRAIWARYRFVESADGVDVFTVSGPDIPRDGATAVDRPVLGAAPAAARQAAR